MKLYELTEEAALLRRMLDEDEVDEESFRLALDALNVEIDAKIANIGLLVKEYKSDIEAISEAIKSLQARKRAAENRIDSLKRYAGDHMTETVKTPLVTVSKQKGRESVVVDMDKVPPEYIDYEPKVDKSRIKDALKSGDSVPGARLERGDDIVVVR
jgi:Siphovirus Gp157.